MMRTALELVGIVSIVISLVFVGLELRQNTEAVKTSNHYAGLELTFSIFSEVLTDAEMFRITDKLVTGKDAELTEEELARGIVWLELTFNIWEATFYNYQSGQLNPEIWEAWDNYFKQIFTPTIRKWWSERKSVYGSSFQAHVDKAVSEE